MFNTDTEPKYFISGLNNLQSKEKCDILRPTDISYLKEIRMITLLSREDIVLNEKRILPSKVVTLYEQTEYNLDRRKCNILILYNGKNNSKSNHIDKLLYSSIVSV